MKRNYLKMGLAFLLAACLFLPGCTGKDVKTDSAKSSVVIKWYFPASTQADLKTVQNAINEKLVKKIGVKLDMQTVDFGSYDEKMNMIKASGEKYDLCYTSSWTNNFINSALTGAFLPLDDYYEKSVLKDEIPDFVWDDTVLNGKIYAVPNYQVEYYQACLMLPQKLADKYNLDTSKIKNKTDIEPFLEQIKNNEPDFFPYNPVDGGNSINAREYDTITGLNAYRVAKSDPACKVICYLDIPSVLQHYNKMREWYQKGYIRKDIVSAAASSRADNQSLKYAVWSGSMKPGSKAENKITFGEDICEIPVNEPFISMQAAQATLTAISLNSDNPDKAWETIEVMNTDKEIYNMIAFGLEGKHYTRISDDTILPKANSGYTLPAWMFGNQFNAYYQEGQDTAIWQETDKINREAARSNLRGFNFDFAPVKNELASISAVLGEYKWLDYGTAEPASVVDEIKTKLKTAGLDKVTVELQNQIDKWLASKK